MKRYAMESGVVVICVLLLTSTVAAAVSPKARCESDKSQEAGKYAACLHRAEARLRKTGGICSLAAVPCYRDEECPLGESCLKNTTKYVAAIARCEVKFARGWDKAEGRAEPAICPDGLLQTDIKGIVEECVDNVVSALGGHGLADCTGDLSACGASLSVCTGELSGCNGNLTTCDAALGTAQTDLASCGGELSTCEADLSQTQADLDACNVNCSGDLISCNADLATCTADLSSSQADFIACSGGLDTCQTDLAQSQSDLTACGGNLATCTGDLSSAQADLSACNGDLGSCQTDLSACSDALGTCPIDLAAAQASLTACAGDLDTCQGDLTQSQSDLAACDGSLTTCTSDLGAAEGDLIACSGDLGTCQADLDQSEADLAACNDALGTCPVELEACELALTGVQGQRVRTGQTLCHDSTGISIPCAGTGHDGDLQTGLVASFTDNGNGTITDNHTGLMWEKLSDDDTIHDKDTTYTWANAFAVKIATLNSGGGFAGYTDWRLPNINELQSLVDYGTLNPAIRAPFNSGCAASCTVLDCSCVQGAGYWSSTTRADTASAAWGVNFNNGTVTSSFKTNPIHVRAVRGEV